jgi:hypothetical protein
MKENFNDNSPALRSASRVASTICDFYFGVSEQNLTSESYLTLQNMKFVEISVHYLRENNAFPFQI